MVDRKTGERWIFNTPILGKVCPLDKDYSFAPKDHNWQISVLESSPTTSWSASRWGLRLFTTKSWLTTPKQWSRQPVTQKWGPRYSFTLGHCYYFLCFSSQQTPKATRLGEKKWGPKKKFSGSPQAQAVLETVCSRQWIDVFLCNTVG